MSCDGDEGEMGWVVVVVVVGDGGRVGGWIEICMCVYDIDQIVLPIFYL